MSTGTVEYPEILLTGPAQGSSVPDWVRPFPAKVVRLERIRSVRKLPELTVVRARALENVLEQASFLRTLVARFEHAATPPVIVFVFSYGKRPAEAHELSRLFCEFSRPGHVGIAQNAKEAPAALCEAFAKLLAFQARGSRHEVERDPLGQIKEIVAATADLRSDTGRLSAPRVADAFGLSTAELAGLIGRSRQAVSKTPDAQSLQPLLQPFERVARLRTLLTEANFLRWLNMPNPQLDERAPLDVIRKGKGAIVGDLAEDMLTGRPS